MMSSPGAPGLYGYEGQINEPWLSTINPDGSPDLTPVGFVQLDGVWYFTSGPGTRKSRNIAADPRCVVSVATQPFDLVNRGQCHARHQSRRTVFHR